MVLVLPEHRRKGYASRLLRVALADLESRGLTAVLDATPAGREVYRQEGFRDTWGFKRYVLSNRSRAAANQVRRSAIGLEMGPGARCAAFGASREMLLRSLAQRLPAAALVVDGKGFILGREGREARQVGPLIALTARRRSACSPRASCSRRSTWTSSAASCRTGQSQRPFTRMVHGQRPAPGNGSWFFWSPDPNSASQVNMHRSQLPSEIAALLRRGTVIPAHLLALDSRRKLDERRQRALTRYYLDAGAAAWRWACMPRSSRSGKRACTSACLQLPRRRREDGRWS